MEEQRHYQVVQDWQLTLQGKQIHGKPSCNVDRLQVTGAKVVGKKSTKKAECTNKWWLPYEVDL